MDEEELEALRHHNYLLGQVSVKETLGPQMRKLAGERFALGKTEEAYLLRSLAEDFERDAKKAREQFEKGGR